MNLTCVLTKALLISTLLALPTLGQEKTLTRPIVPPDSDAPQYVVEVRYVTCTLTEIDDDYPECVQQSFKQLDFDCIKVIGGNEVPTSNVTNQLSLDMSTDGTSAMLCATLSDTAAKEFMQSLKGNREISLTQAPTATMYANQQVSIQDTSSRPFVTGVSVVSDDTNNKRALQPEVNVFIEGTTMNVRIDSSGDNERIEGTFCNSQIDGVRLLNIANPLGENNETVTLQVPIMTTNKIFISSVLEPNKTLFFDLGNSYQTRRTEQKNKTLQAVPYANRLFKKPVIEKVPVWMGMLVRVVRIEDAIAMNTPENTNNVRE